MIREAAADLKFRLHLFQSDGRGGIHGWIYFDSPVPSERVYGMLKKIVGNDFVETFPKQPSIGPSEFGNWLRLPGRHYKRAAWARMFGECGWLSPDATIDAILQIEPDDARRVPQYKVEIPIISRPVYQGHRSHFAESPETLRSWLESKGVEVKALKPCSNGAVRLILGLCPFNPDHGDGRSDTSVMVVWSALGLRFCCLHNRCRAYRWVHLREKLDDAYRSRRRC
ncbi:MAG: hypothetical protein IPK83_04305 [Planctomycetes bacterium]|nr:hypothetical protein [Planctomycetota bacterium]